MVVLSRLLYGTLHAVRYDIFPPRPPLRKGWFRGWFGDNGSGADGEGEGIPVEPQRSVMLNAPEISVLYLRSGNAHEFREGGEGAAVLDVLVPPHDDQDCAFYDVVGGGEGGDRGWRLVKVEVPEDFECVGGSYGSFGVEGRGGDD